MVAQHEAGRAERALESLDRVGLSAYRPVYRRRTMQRGRAVWNTRPLLDRYFFIRHDDNWRDAYREDVIGVSRVITKTDVAEPHLVDDEPIEALRQSEVHGYVPMTPHRFKLGQRVKFPFGPFGADFVGMYDGLSKDTSFEEIVFNIFGRSQRARLAYGVAEAA